MSDERRNEDRLQEANSVAIKVIRAPEAPELEGETFFSTTEDVSVRGIRFVVHTWVPKDAILEMRVGFSKPLGAFRHLGRVAWVKTEEQGEDADVGVEAYALGIEFLNESAEKLLVWRDIIERKLSRSPSGSDDATPGT